MAHGGTRTDAKTGEKTAYVVPDAVRDAYDMLDNQRAHFVRRLANSRADVVELEHGLASIDAALRRLEDPA